MIFKPCSLDGAWVIEIEPISDERGFFSRIVCRKEFKKNGINTNFVQENISWNRLKGTLRGLHYQIFPYEEDKLVRVTSGAIYDVIVDLRVNSKTYGKWFGVELSALNRKQLYIPKGFAHGFQTLEPNTELLYQMTAFFHPESSKGIRWNDNILNIQWPLNVIENDRSLLSNADANLPYWGKE